MAPKRIPIPFLMTDAKRHFGENLDLRLQLLDEVNHLK